MNYMISHLLTILVALVVTASSYGAQELDVRGNVDKNAAIGNTLNQSPLVNVSDETLLRLLEERRDQKIQEESTGESRDEINRTEKGSNTTLKNAVRKTQLLVKSEPGDGLVKLTWRLVNLPPKVDAQTLRFTIRYGTESEKPIKSLQVGPGDGYILRDLKKQPALFHSGSGG